MAAKTALRSNDRDDQPAALNGHQGFGIFQNDYPAKQLPHSQDRQLEQRGQGCSRAMTLFSSRFRKDYLTHRLLSNKFPNHRLYSIAKRYGTDR
jgi:hypothetical protein